MTLTGFELGTSCMDELKNSWYLNLSGYGPTLHATPYNIPYSERAFFGLPESVVHVNGTQIFASLDFRKVYTLLQRGEQTRNSNTSKKIIFFSYDVRAPRYAQGTDTSTTN